MSARVLTPTLIICGAAAIGGGIALARPAAPVAAPVTTAAAPAATADAGSAAGTGAAGPGYGRKPTATTTPRSTAPKGQAPAGGAAKAATLTISGFAFGSPLTVSPGTKVAVRNADGAPHTVSGNAFDTGTVAGGGSGSFTAPTAPGTYRFSCQIHPSMTGSLTVR
jgi:plastocyanin